MDDKTKKSDLQDRAIWGKISGDVEASLLKISAKIERRTSKGIEFTSNAGLFEIKIERK